MMFEDCECTNPICAEHGGFSLCRLEERAIRRIAEGSWGAPMTGEQRRWCVQQADHAGGWAYHPEDTKDLPDRELAAAVLQAWLDHTVALLEGGCNASN